MTENFSSKLHIRWSDLDPNFHLRHSVYYDYAAQLRVKALHAMGVTVKVMVDNHFGPILFREECIFKREILMNDEVTIHMEVTKLRADFSRWSISHQFVKSDGTLAAVLNVDGAWIDTQLRKLTIPPQIGLDALNAFPKSDNFEIA